MSKTVIDKYVSLNEMQFANGKKQRLDDYLIQKNYFREKKDTKLFKSF